MSSGVNHNIDGANPIKCIVKYRFCHCIVIVIVIVIVIALSLCIVKYRFFSHVKSRRIYLDSLHMIDAAKSEIEGVNHDIDGTKCQVVEYFVVYPNQI